MIIDTHCHLNFRAFRGDVEEIVQLMHTQDVRAIVVGSQSTTSQRAVDLARRHPDILRAAVALHPLHLFTRNISRDEVEHPFTSRAEQFNEQYYTDLAQDPNVVAVGECGLDYYSQPTDIDEAEYKNVQQEVFNRHIKLAQSLKIPLIVHTRSHPTNYVDAHKDALSIIQQSGYDKVVWHAFATKMDVAQAILRAGHMVSYTGLIANPRFKDISVTLVQATPLERMMIETDAPYMVVPESRAGRNTPLGVLDVARYIAEYKQVDISNVIRITTQNALRFFNIKEWLTQ